MRFLTGVAAGAAISTSAIYASFLHTQRQRTRQSILLREQALILDSIHDRAVMVPEEAPISVLRTALRRVDPYESYKRWWNARVEGFGEWLTGGGLESAIEGAEKGVARKLQQWTGGEKGT